MTTFVLNRTPLAALALACAVFREHGFVKRNDHYTDPKSGNHVFDSRTIVMHNLKRYVDGVDQHSKVPHVEVTEADVEHAAVVFATFDQRAVLAKLSDNCSDYDNRIEEIFKKDEINNHVDISIISSLPHSYMIQQRRDRMELFYANNARGGYIGRPKDELVVDTVVHDVKYVKNSGIYLVVTLTEGGQIAKFFLRGDDKELADEIRGHKITLRGTVKRHSVNKHTECDETMFHLVKIVTIGEQVIDANVTVTV